MLITERIASLSGTRRIDFVSPLPLERCISILDSAGSNSLLSYPTTRVALSRVDQTTFRFTISQSYPSRLGASARASGVLKRTEHGSKTHVVGQVEPNWFGLVSLPFVILIPLIFAPPEMKLLLMLVLLAVWHWGLSWHNNLAKFIEDRLLAF